MATTVLHTVASSVRAPGILTLKDFQQKNGIGPWMARVRIFLMWHETDFMKTNDVTSLDLLLLDDTGDLLHAIVQKKFIWKFEPLIEEGMLLCLNNLTFNDYRAYFNWNTDITPLEASSALIPRHKFNFTELDHTNLQQFKQNSGNASFMREITLENLSGVKIKVTLWGDSTYEITRNLAVHELNPRPVVVVVAGVYVKQYLGNASLSSTNATKIYFDIDIPEVLHIRERSSHRTPPREIKIPVSVGYNEVAKSIGDTTISISQPLDAKWEFGYNVWSHLLFSI
ncbi:hypothetical protein MKX03_029954 [Papaver bracteatum]|nr:hypothetical protein MKX03_029954 [Papaver bracteatum]